MQEDHPVANYRLGYLYYRNREYTKAVSYFEKALDGSVEDRLTLYQRNMEEVRMRKTLKYENV